MSGVTELWQMSAGDLARLIRARQASSREVVDAHLDRIDAVNGRVNAIVEVLAEPARAQADAADRAVAAGDARGALHGVPVTIKQNIDVAGTATTLGVQALKDAIAPQDSPPVERLREAGAIVIGRTNLPDVALRWHTDSSLAGATINPWDADASPGGSSGGEAVSLATGMSPLGVGTDLGGSVRIPAAACGVVSLKVTWGRVADVSVVAPPPPPAIARMDTTGPMARRVADLRTAFDLLRGPSDRDARYRAADLPERVEPTRFAVVVPDGTHPDVARALERAAGALEDAGWTRGDATTPDFGAALEMWLVLIGHDIAEVMPLLREVCGEQALAFLDLMLGALPNIDDATFDSLITGGRDALIAEWAAFQATTPLVVAPVMTQPTYSPGADLVDPLAVTASLACVPPLNLLGLPAAVVPVGRSGNRPIGAQLIGPAWREDVCLAAAEVLEAAGAPVTPIDPR